MIRRGCLCTPASSSHGLMGRTRGSPMVTSPPRRRASTPGRELGHGMSQKTLHFLTVAFLSSYEKALCST